MNLLIVDDEEEILQGILNGVRWELLDFEEIYTAKSYEKAVELFETKEIAILLSDIEMSSRNGLELIEWVNQHRPDTECLIISCHDEFELARKAVALKCREYILKPVPYEELTEILGRTQETVRHEHSQSLLNQYGKLYMKQMKDAADMENPEDCLEIVTAFIKEHIAEEMTVEYLAKMAHISPRQLGRIFQKRLRQSVGEYILQQRMMLAGELLRNKKLSVTMVSDKVGYGHYSYFTKLFKKFYGMTPREYQVKYGQYFQQ